MNRKGYWIDVIKKISMPVLENLASRTLRKNMPVETCSPSIDRHFFAYLEAFGRLLAGIAPWLELKEPESHPLLALTLESLDSISSPTSPDFGNFINGEQPLVDAAFLAQGLLRAPNSLWHPLDERVKLNLLDALRSTRVIRPFPNNWLLFSAMIETSLYVFGEPDWDRTRIDYALRQHEQWYKGDGVYGDGPFFHADYYNSFVIQPMLMDIIRHVGKEEDWGMFEDKILKRSMRYAEILERTISPEGTFPALGRSICYRLGVMHSLAQMAFLQKLPPTIAPAQVREALEAVMRRVMEAPGTFDQNGWLKIGLCGSQPELGEHYISTGSLYLCATGLLPLGLPLSAALWSAPPEPWTSVKAWSGAQTPIDHALHD